MKTVDYRDISLENIQAAKRRMIRDPSNVVKLKMWKDLKDIEDSLYGPPVEKEHA